MQNEKIFKELEGIFTCINLKRKQKSETQETSSYHQIKEFFNFLNLEATNEEIEALNELANPNGDSNISYEAFYNVFVQTQEQQQQEKQALYNAFKLFSKDQDYIQLEKLEKCLMIYDKKYKNSIDQIVTDMKQTESYREGIFYFKEYLDNYYKDK